MNRITLEQYLNDPKMEHRVYAQARRDRALAIGALLGSLLGSLVLRAGALLQALKPTRPARWVERLG